MIDENRVLAIVPARKGSKGLPLKNVRPLEGHPLLAWPIMAANNSSYIDKVIISTDDQNFADIAVGYGAECPFLRPEELATDTASSIDFIIHAIEQLSQVGEKFDWIVLLEPTSPLTMSSDIDSALELLSKSSSDADSVVGVSLLETAHPAFTVKVQKSGLIKPYMSNNFKELPRRQDLEELYCLDGSLYITKVDALLDTKAFCHDRTLPFITERYKSFEVDDLVDFVCIEAIMKNMQLITSQSN